MAKNTKNTVAEVKAKAEQMEQKAILAKKATKAKATPKAKAEPKAKAKAEPKAKVISGVGVSTTTTNGKNYFNSCNTAEECKAKFYELATTLKGKARTAMLEQFNTAFESLKTKHSTKDGKVYEKATEETAEQFANLIFDLSKIKGIKVEMCGSWIWVSGDTKPNKDTLKALGFWFSAKKSAWYNNGGLTHKRSKNYTLDEIRSMWGSEAV